MDNRAWYHQQTNPYGAHSPPNQGASSSSNNNAIAADFHDAQRVLAGYPFASATPASSHVTRHLNNLSTAVTVPSYIHPEYYQQPGNPPPYTPYAELAAPQIPPPGPQRQFWETARDEAVRLLMPEAAQVYQPPQQQQWSTQPYDMPPFAASIIQNTRPYLSSSSSLALALGDPQMQSTRSTTISTPTPSSVVNPPSTKPQCRPEDSVEFFNSFLAETSRQIATQETNTGSTFSQAQILDVKTPVKHLQSLNMGPMSSPDPLALKSDGFSSPRKRKPEMMESPSIKRTLSNDKFAIPRERVQPIQSTSTPRPALLSPTKNLQVYIEVPSRPKGLVTPSTSGRSKSKSYISSGTADLGGFSPPPESDWEDDHKGLAAASKSTPRRTGDRDERVPLEKLTAFIEDIFEAEDAVSPDADTSSLSRDWFSIHTVDCTRPQLSTVIIRKLIKLTSQIARPSKRVRLARDTPRKPRVGSLSEMETSMLSRLLKILERSVKVGEDIDPFGSAKANRKASPIKSPTKAGAKIGKKVTSKVSKNARGQGKELSLGDATEGQQDEAMEIEEQEEELTYQDFQKLEKLLEIANESVLAADCCVALLAADKLPKQLYSEELITACFATIKNQLIKVIYPFVESVSDVHGQTTPLLLHVAQSTDHSSQFYRRDIGEMFQALTAVFPRVNALMGSEVAMSDTIVIQVVYIAIGPFFVVEPGVEHKSKKDNTNSLVLSALGGKGAMRALRLEALSLIRSIFANHEDQRSWIIEEILTSLIKLPDLKQKSGQFRLRDGRSIHTVSALLLQLVQTSAHDVRIRVRRLALNRQESFVMRSDTNSQEASTNGSFLTERDYEEIQFYNAGVDSASKAAKTIVLFLTQRSGKGKATKSSNEAEYRAIFDNLIADLLTVLYWPEWPAAALLLRIICAFMISSLSDKSSNNTDNNAAKTVALDHLGVIAARLVSSSLKFRNAGKGPFKNLEEIISNPDLTQLKRLVSVQQDIFNHLSKRASEDQACDSARELSAITWGQELSGALLRCNSLLKGMHDEGDDYSGRGHLGKLADNLKTALRNIWQEAAHDVFDIGSEEDVARVDRLSEELGTTQSLSHAFDGILNVILLSLDSAAVFMRTKALRALGQIVTADPSILRNGNVRKAIETHLLDSSPQVRDAAVELIGKYVNSIPEVADNYYAQIADRIADTGLAVRKRVIKMLRTFYSVSSQHDRQVDICTKLVLRMNDEDESVKDLSLKTLEDIWFGDPQTNEGTSKSNSRFMTSPSHDRNQLLIKVSVIMGVSSQFRDRQSPLEDLLHKIIMDKDGKELESMHNRYIEIGNALIDCLVDDQELPAFTVVNCIKTIYLFVSAHPAIISTQQATTLLPYLKNATTIEEQTTSDYLLKIFRVSTPGMSKTASKFARELQSVLQNMLMKPSGPNWATTLQETVACLCSVVRHLTHDFHLLVALLKSCNARLREHLTRPGDQDLDGATKKKLNLQVFISSLLCEHYDFDKLREENQTSANELNTISKCSLTEHIYNTMLRLYQKFNDPLIRARLLDCLGFLFRAYPTLMTLETSATIMDAIFSSPEEEARGRLLKIMQDFLITESTKHSAQEKAAYKAKVSQSTKVNMEELVGNTEGFADSGVSSAIVQRYLPQILDAAVTKNVQMQAAAVDILGFTVKQGLAHPLQCLPVIVALETSPNLNLSNRTGALHAILFNKHHSLVNTRHIECARASFDYQKKITPSAVRGYRLTPSPMALLHRWYTLVREKRASRQDFLKTIMKIFELDSTKLSSTQDEVDFIRYMAENVSAFDFKTLEEVLTVIRQLTSILSVTGMALIETIAPTTLNGQPLSMSTTTPTQNPGLNLELNSALFPLGSAQGSVVGRAQDQLLKNTVDIIDQARSTVAVGIILILKSYLKTMYGLNEDKCSKWIPGKKSTLGDKPAVKKREIPLEWDQMPFAMKPIRTEEEASEQKQKFLEIWAEDPVTAEPEDDLTEL